MNRSYLFDRSVHDESHDGHIFLLPEPEYAAHCLALDSGVPLRLEDVDTIGNCQVKPVE